MRAALLLIVVLLPGAGSPLIRDLDGGLRHPLAPPRAATLLVFVTSDCPISNGYAPEIGRMCASYAVKGVDCLLLYEDARIAAGAARAHRTAYALSGIAAAIDDRRTIASAAGATTTPEAAVVDRDGAIRYRGRIDDVYVALGRRRQAATTHDLRDALDAVLAGRPVARPRTHALGCYIASPLRAAKEPS
jgi:hypothetical protein